jgi:hypothetical protein
VKAGAGHHPLLGLGLARQRLQQQRLTGTSYARPEDVVEGLLAIQSQDYLAAKWAVAQRTRDSDDAAVTKAFQEGRILRTHVLRPTWHFVAPADIRWLLELTAPRVHALNAYYYRKHGLDAALVQRSNTRIVKALSRGKHLTRDELGRALREGDTAMTGNRLAYFIMRAELDALICSGAMRGKQHTYALLEERVPPKSSLGRDEALARIARRYVSGHGPAQIQDLAWWSGLTVADAKRGFEASRGELAHDVVDGKTYWFVPQTPLAHPRGPVVHLLPNYDELVTAFKDRSAMLDPRITPRLDVLSAHFVLIDGRIVGGWRRTLGKREVLISAQLLRPLSVRERKGLDAAAASYARSLGLELRLEAEGVP